MLNADFRTECLTKTVLQLEDIRINPSPGLFFGMKQAPICDRVWNSPLRNCWESINTNMITAMVASPSIASPRIT